jgi:DNA-binding transcriptional MocR family regulator
MNPQAFNEKQQPNLSSRHFTQRMANTPKSCIREILKVTENPSIISFAGGLPNPDLIDVNGISNAAATVLGQDGKSALQYSTTEVTFHYDSSLQSGTENVLDYLFLQMRS